MLPITVDLARIRVMLTGAGETARRRLALLDAAGALSIEIYAPQADTALAAAAGSRLRRRLPRPEEIAQAQLVFISGLRLAQAARIRQIAGIAGVLVNVEDDRSGCDFHSPAVVRRGDLTIAIATNGKSPGLAAWLRHRIARMFGPEWAARLEEVAALRQDWRASGADAATVGRLTAQWTEAKMARK
jgi:precorrin-2 dehydrogenase / sirohydrochlorin ferrochelatase